MNHLIDWYSNGFWIATFAMVLWHFVKEHEGWSKLVQFFLVIGITIYAISFSFISLQAGSKLVLLSKDLIILGFISLLFQALRNYKRVYWLSIILLYACSRLFISSWQKGFLSNPIQIGQSENEWELFVELNESGDASILHTIVEKYQLKIEPSFNLVSKDQTTLDNFLSIEIPQQQESKLMDIKSELSLLRSVEWLEDNEMVTVDPIIPVEQPAKNGFKAMTNDPHAGFQWPIELLGWNQLTQLYNNGKLKPVKKAKLFILDTGIDGGHEDLKSSYVSIERRNEIDEKGHGTHVAGIAAAVTNNKLGISSVIPANDFISITSIKVLGSFGAGTQRDIINGILKAADEGAAVINMSLGGRSLDSRQKAYNDAVAYAQAKGAIVVVAAGNDNTDARGFAPANVEGVITVSAIDESLNKASYSNTVTHIKNKIAAPGSNIYSSIPRNQYASFNGTSMAAPFVSGLIACMKSLHPNMSTTEAYTILTSTGSQSNSPEATGPIIHAGRAIEKTLQSFSTNLK